MNEDMGFSVYFTARPKRFLVITALVQSLLGLIWYLLYGELVANFIFIVVVGLSMLLIQIVITTSAAASGKGLMP